MKKYATLLFLLIAFYSPYSSAQNRFLYVDHFDVILEDMVEQNKLLDYAYTRNIDCLMLYGLRFVHKNHDLTDTASNQIMADFIRKAKTSYNIKQITAISENAFAFEKFNDYNNTRTDSLEKFDAFNLEFEFWNNGGVHPGGYYCTSYLEPNDFPCDTSGAFEFYMEQLMAIKAMAQANSHNIMTESYVGWFNKGQALEMAAVVDRLLVHAYRTSPHTAFPYTESRLQHFGSNDEPLDVSILYSAENHFMGPWLQSHSIVEAEQIFMDDYDLITDSWKHLVNIIGFSYFTYSYMESIPLDMGEQLTGNSTVHLYPNPANHILNIQTNSPEGLTNIELVNFYGKAVLKKTFHHQTSIKLDLGDLKSGAYYIRINNDQAKNSSAHRIYVR